MRRRSESMNDEKKSATLGRALLSGPYLIWDDRFYHYPLALIFWFGITNKNGSLTLANITAIMNPDHWKALWLSLGLSLVSTILCLILAYPLAMILRGRGSSASGFIVFIFILPMWMNFLLRTMAWQTLLERNGVINGILAWLHLPKQNLINTRQPLSLEWYTISFHSWYCLSTMYLQKLTTTPINAAKDLGANYFTDSVLYLAAFKPSRYYQLVLPWYSCLPLPSFVISDLLGGSNDPADR